MRNLKRALSLTLASVMLLGMMVIGSSAAQGYSDVTEDNNVEAIEVLQTIKVMVGDERGFGPERPVNRAEMAVVMALLLNLDYDYYVSTCPFNDVYDWARGPVGACYANGIVSGRGDGVYDPGATVTAVEAASMLMRALGYFRYQNDYEGNFVLSTVKQGTKIGIFDGVGSSADQPLTRDEVAKMVLNALQTGMVEPDGNTLNLNTPDGKIYTGKVNYVNVTSNKPFATAISSVRASSMGSQNDSPIVELGEQLYSGKLKLNSNTTDVFGRPARHWEFDGKSIGTYAKKELLEQEYTVKVTGRDLYDQIGSATLNDKDYDVFIYVDGETEKDVLGNAYFARGDMNKNNKDGVGGTGNGVLTQVFVDGNRKEVTVAIINTYLARANADYSEKKDNVTFTVYKIDDVKNSKTAPVYAKAAGKTENITVTGEDFDIKDVMDGDAYRVNIADGEIQTLIEAEVIGDSTLTAFSKKDYVISDGTQYDYANAIQYDPEVLEEWTQTVVNLKDRKYNLYMDAYGYVLGIDLVEDPDNYVFISGVDSSTSNLASTNFKANAIFLDGTMKVIEINGKKSTFNSSNWEAPLVNRWFTYTLNNTTNIYSVDEVNDEISKANAAEGTIVTSHPNKKLAQFASEDVITNLSKNMDLNKAVRDTTTLYDIDVKHVSLPGTGANIAAGQKEFSKVYGNDDTVYITTEVETINPDNKHTGDFVGVISDVNNVTTGVDKANIKTYSKAEAMVEADKNGKYKIGTAETAAYGAYSLYKDNGYIIATVVVGEDNAAAKNLVYVHTDDVNLETYTASDDEWTWTRKVVYNGEEVEIKEVGDKLTYLDKMNQYNWYQVKFNAKDEVIGVQLAENALKYTTSASNGDEYVTNVEWIEAAINEKNTVLYEESLYNGYTLPTSLVNFKARFADKNNANFTWNEVNDPKMPELKGHTFYVRTTDKTGFVVNDDVKTVFIQRRDNKLETYFEDSYKDLQDILDDLNYDNVNSLGYRYEVSAILENGRAKVVVIHDLNGDDYKPSESPDHHTVTAKYDKWYTFDITVSDACAPNNVEVAAAIRYELETNFGAKDVKVDFDANKVVTVSWTAPGGEVVTLSVERKTLVVNYFRHITVNSSKVKIGANTTVDDVLKEVLNLDNGDYSTYFTNYPTLKVTWRDRNGDETVDWSAKSTIAGYAVDGNVGVVDTGKGDVIAIESGYVSANIKGSYSERVDAVKEIISNPSASAVNSELSPAANEVAVSDGVKAGTSMEQKSENSFVIALSGTADNTESKGFASALGTDASGAALKTDTHVVVPVTFKIPADAKAIQTNNGTKVALDESEIAAGEKTVYFILKIVNGKVTSENKSITWYADAEGNTKMGETITYRMDASNVKLKSAEAVEDVKEAISDPTEDIKIGDTPVTQTVTQGLSVTSDGTTISITNQSGAYKPSEHSGDTWATTWGFNADNYKPATHVCVIKVFKAPVGAGGCRVVFGESMQTGGNKYDLTGEEDKDMVIAVPVPISGNMKQVITIQWYSDGACTKAMGDLINYTFDASGLNVDRTVPSSED